MYVIAVCGSQHLQINREIKIELTNTKIKIKSSLFDNIHSTKTTKIHDICKYLNKEIIIFKKYCVVPQRKPDMCSAIDYYLSWVFN